MNHDDSPGVEKPAGTVVSKRIPKMAEKKADGAKPRSGWGGRRPGTGRKKGQGKGLTEHLQVSVTPLQKETFRRAGGNMWMRHVLDVESAAELPPGAMVMKTELSHAEIEYEV